MTSQVRADRDVSVWSSFSLRFPPKTDMPVGWIGDSDPLTITGSLLIAFMRLYSYSCCELPVV